MTRAPAFLALAALAGCNRDKAPPAEPPPRVLTVSGTQPAVERFVAAQQARRPALKKLTMTPAGSGTAQASLWLAPSEDEAAVVELTRAALQAGLSYELATPVKKAK